MALIIAYQLIRRLKSIRYIFSNISFKRPTPYENTELYYIIYLEWPSPDIHAEFDHHLVG